MAQIMKNLSIRLEPDFHRELKAFLALKGISAQDYVKRLIKKDMEMQKNNNKGDNK